MTQSPTLLPPRDPLNRDPLAVIAVSAAPIVLDGRYRLLVGALARLRRSRRGGWAFAVGYGAVAIALALLAARHFATTSWPLSSGAPGLLVAAGLLLLLAQALKAFGWARLFRLQERPSALALAAGNGGAALVGVRALALSLVMLGLVDSAALAPLASVGAAFPGAGIGVRAGLAVVGVGGVAAAAVIVALPRLSASRRALRFRLGRWLSPRTTSLRRASEAWALVSGCWLVRAVAVFLLLGTLGIGFSFPLALLFLCAGAAAAALPIGPAGTAAQVGAGATALIAWMWKPRRRSPSPSPSPGSGSYPGPRYSSSPLPGVPGCRWSRHGPRLLETPVQP